MNQNPSFLKEQDLKSPEGDSPASEQQGIPSPSQSPGNQEPKASFSVKKEVISWLLHFAGAFVLVFIIQAFLFVPVRVQGSSMARTLENQEFVLATKYDYLFSDPNRHDVVICHYPGRERKMLGGLATVPENFVKRVIGLPGDTIEIKYNSQTSQKVFFINGQPLDEPYITPENNTRFSLMEPVVLGEDEYFVVGDNRDNSNDSRNLRDVGPISRKAILSHVRFVLFPFTQWGSVQ